MKPFTKLFASIITSSIWSEEDHVRVVWITMLALSDAQGFVGASIGGLAHAARVTKADCESALGCLLEPDDDSRSQEYDGRRIEIVEGGFKILNYTKYRELGRSIDRNEYLAEKQRESRARRSQQTSTPVNTSSTTVNKPSTLPSASASSSVKGKDGDCKGKGTQVEVEAFCESLGLPRSDGEATFNQWEGNGWTNRGKRILDWKATIRAWKIKGFMPSQRPKPEIKNFGFAKNKAPLRNNKVWEELKKMEEEARQ